MKKIINFIVDSNRWYDYQPEWKRFLLFMIFVFGGVLLGEYLLYFQDMYWPLASIVLLFSVWRVSFTFISWIEWYKKNKK